MLIAILFVVGLLGAYAWQIAGAASVIGVVVLARWTYGRVGAVAVERRLRDMVCAARADEQHAAALAGDPHGTFGDYPPAVV